jgi:glyoxylase-like metal-dependent hydrolase (beta-lactamase superfamily II)
VVTVGEWVEVGDRVFARRYEHLDQTLGLVVGRQRCLVIDTGGDEVQGEEFATAIRGFTSLPWTMVITHAHFDHYFGTARFRPCQVWSHERCRAAMAANADHDRAVWAASFAEEGERELADRLTNAELVLPDEVVSHQTELDLGGRVVRLLYPGPAHTHGDLMVHVPDARVVFAGDLVESGAPPSIGPDADPAGWPTALDKILALRPGIVVPGHGYPEDTAFVERQRDELHQFFAVFHAVKTRRMSVEQALRYSPYTTCEARLVLERVSRS